MPIVFNLPPLNPKQEKVSALTRGGMWIGENVSLDGLADSFDITDKNSGIEGQKSIPDVWAQFQVFCNAFVQSSLESSLHDEAVRQWRALLSLFALAGEYKDRYEIALRPIEFPPPPKEGEAPQSVFRQVLRYLLPETSFDKSALDWSRSALFFVRERQGAGRFATPGQLQLLGMLNPVTLVAPGKASTNLKLANIPWLKAGWCDPTDKATNQGKYLLKSRDYRILAEYLGDLLEAVGGTAQPATDSEVRILGALTRELSLFGRDCDSAAGEMQHYLEVKTLDAPGGLDPFYRQLLKTREIKTGDYPVGGDTELKLRIDIGKQPFAGLVLLDGDLSDTLNVEPNSLRIWRNKTLSDLSSQAAFDTAQMEATAAGYVLVRRGDFFTDELVHLEDGTDIQGHVRGSGFDATIMPFSPLLLLVMTPDAIAKSARMESLGDQKFRVSIDVPLAKSGKSHKLSRTYDLDSGSALRAVRDIERPMGLAIWPDFQHPRWKWNFLRFENDPTSSELQTRFGLSGAQLARELNALTNPIDRSQRLIEWLNPAGCAVDDALLAERVTPEDTDRPSLPLQRLRFVEQPQNRGELQISAAGFEVICLSRRPRTNEDIRPVGLVLIQRMPAPPTDSGKRVVAVDFGSTNTVAAVDRGLKSSRRTGNAERGNDQVVTVYDRVVFPIASGTDKGTQEERNLVKWSFMDFMPLGEHEMPTPTVAVARTFHETGDAALGRVANGTDGRPLFSESAFFMAVEQGNTTGASGNWFRANAERLRFGLKWSKDEHTRRITARFLRQVIMLISAEMFASGIDPQLATWRFSYPEAMSKTDKTALESSVRNGWSSVFVAEDGTRNINSNAAVPPFVTEGGAAANWFVFTNGGDVNAGPLAIILDIGGSTTDVAIWSNRKVLRWRNSFRIAGGDFLTNYLVNNPEIFEKIGLADLASLLRDVSGERKSSIIERRADQGANVSLNFGELLFSDKRFQKSFDTTYAVISATSAGSGLRVCATVALAGLIYYVGQVVKKLVADGTIPATDVNAVSFSFGGRGSQFFRQQAGANPNAADSPLQDILKIFFDSAGVNGAKGPVRALFSPRPKMEVVLGMLGNDPSLKAAQEKPESNWLPIGEVLKAKNNSGEAVTLPEETSTQELLSSPIQSVPELVTLKKFLQSLAKATEIRIDLKESVSTGAGRSIAEYVFFEVQEAANRASSENNLPADAATQAIEPPFITALRALIDRLGQSEASRAASLRVSE